MKCRWGLNCSWNIVFENVIAEQFFKPYYMIGPYYDNTNDVVTSYISETFLRHFGLSNSKILRQ